MVQGDNSRRSMLLEPEKPLSMMYILIPTQEHFESEGFVVSLYHCRAYLLLSFAAVRSDRLEVSCRVKLGKVGIPRRLLHHE